MSVEPGFGGQEFIPEMLSKVRMVRKMVDSGELTILVEIDGGINADNIEQAAEAGVDCFVAGSAVYGAKDPASAVEGAAGDGPVPRRPPAPMSVEAAISYEAAMRLAVEHADLVKGATYPNPPVGAVILDRDGRVVGVGGTQPTGSAHAEVVALRRGRSARCRRHRGGHPGASAITTARPRRAWMRCSRRASRRWSTRSATRIPRRPVVRRGW